MNEDADMGVSVKGSGMTEARGHGARLSNSYSTLIAKSRLRSITKLSAVEPGEMVVDESAHSVHSNDDA